MMGVSRGAVWIAAMVLVGVAGVGSYLGYSRASAAPGGSADSDAYAETTPLAAKNATAVNDAAAPPPVDENYIRKIAHDEAMTILHPAPKKVAVAQASDDDDSDDSDEKDAASNPPTPPPAAAAPAPIPAPKPPPPPTGLY